jgi:alkanesulfonate monooxygenase SsuD/methylene tetrahydromethanopterin reductase-like flavin-dependent oxidoreductase (luciferase family)
MRADRLGWQGLENGALLDAAEQAGFDLLLTCDQYRPNFTSRKLALVILSSNHWPTLRRIAARVATTVDFV